MCACVCIQCILEIHIFTSFGDLNSITSPMESFTSYIVEFQGLVINSSEYIYPVHLQIHIFTSFVDPYSIPSTMESFMSNTVEFLGIVINSSTYYFGEWCMLHC